MIYYDELQFTLHDHKLLRLHVKHMTLKLWHAQVESVSCISLVNRMPGLMFWGAATAGLAGKEHSNPQFMFLKPTHSMFGFFTSLCDAYSRVLMPDKGLMLKLHQDASDRYTQQLCYSYVTPVHTPILFRLRSC